MTSKCAGFATLSVAGWRIYLEYERWRVNCPGCGGVHVEHLDWLANNSRYTQRFALASRQAVPGYAEQGGGRDGTSAPQYREGAG